MVRGFVSVLCALLLVCAAPAAGAAVVVDGDPWDQIISTDGTMTDIPYGRIGAAPTQPGPGAQTAVYAFHLPAPGANELPQVASASFRFTIRTDLANGTYDFDLFGLPARSDPEVLETDNYFGPTAGAPAANSLIQAGILKSDNTLTGDVQTSPAGGVALAAYLNAQYGPGGAGAGKYVFLRLNPDEVPSPTETTGVEVYFADSAVGIPQLTVQFTPVPEPIGGAAVLMLALLGGRARRVLRSV
jgi:hypothetical protein